MKIRDAKTSDVRDVQRLVNDYAKKYEVIPRSLSELYESVRDLIVCEEDGKVVGACALHVMDEDLAEIRSLAVNSTHLGRGIGHKLVRRALKEAGTLGVQRVFALTYVPEYFVRWFSFKVIKKAKLPQKIWGDCIKCHKFPDCNETAVLKELGTDNKD